ncbi:MAG: lipid-A-disaccharide synthase [Acidobacteria bacterium]|nr:MAG: lipid-A-disaccharide synthase [Acidobacteriota bacterium]
MRVLVSAGEVSGDVAGARLCAEVLRRQPDAALFGIGGSRMAAAGVELLASTNHLGTVGVSESFRTAPGLLRAFAELRRRVRREPPDVAVLIGNDVFNVLLGRWLKRRGVTTVSYFPPQVWIWRSLARVFRRSFDAVLCCFPDELTVYQRAGAKAVFVGHYLGEALSRVTPEERAGARAGLGLPPGARVVGVLPGSRVQELRTLLPALLGAAAILSRRDPSLRFVLPVAEESFRETIVAQAGSLGLTPVLTLGDDSHAAMRASDLLLLASGTASLEAALIGVPMVIAYRVSKLTIGVVRSAIALRLMDSETVGLPNLVLGRHAVPELIQGRVTAEAIAAEAEALLGSPERLREMEAALAEVARRVAGGGSVARAADAVLALATAPETWAPAHAGAPVRQGEAPSAAPGGR